MKTLKTPEHLQKQFGIPASAGEGRAIPRVLLAYRGPQKKHFLASTFALIVSGALPAHGQNRRQFRLKTQQDLGAMTNVTRETFTRWISQFAPLQWSDADRDRHSSLQKDVARRAGRRVLDRARRRSKAGVAIMLNRRRGFAEANRYELRIPNAVGDDKYKVGTLRDIKEDPNVSHLFHALEEAIGFKSWDSFKMIPIWLWDARLDLSYKARLVLSYYIMCGLLDRDKKTAKVRGAVNPRQSTISAALGLSIKSIYRANGELARMGLIRVAHPKPVQTAHRVVRGPAIILYLPVRQFTMEEAEAERERYARALAPLRASAEAMAASKVFHALMNEWQGKEHCLGAFWNELRRRLTADGIPRSTINGLVPKPPNL